MKKQVHKPDGEKKNRVISKIGANAKGDHPLLQLQQIIGNKAVSNLIQRHSAGDLKQYAFWTQDKKTGEKMWLDIRN